jgi:hypothetical protein
MTKSRKTTKKSAEPTATENDSIKSIKKSAQDNFAMTEDATPTEPAPTPSPPPPPPPPKKKPSRSKGKTMTKTAVTIDSSGSAVGIGDTARLGSSIKPASTTNQYPIANIILHLKCNLKDLATYNEDLNKQIVDPLSYNPAVPPDLLTYNQYETTKNYSALDGGDLSPPHEEDYAYRPPSTIYQEPSPTDEMEPNQDGEDITPSTRNEEFSATAIGGGATAHQTKNEMKDIYTKLKKLKIMLFKNMSYMEKKSACFWCTYEFDNPECYIPKYEIDGTIHGYGCFCRPECAAAYLMKENIDDSSKFERYHLLNQIYSKVFDYTKNIKPAPSPYYMLDKFYGNMSIQEYRKLLKSQHLLFVIEKPLTRVLPELHEDNDEFLSNIYGTSTISAGATGPVSTSLIKSQQTGIYKVRRQSDKVGTANTKTNLMKEHFGVTVVGGGSNETV